MMFYVLDYSFVVPSSNDQNVRFIKISAGFQRQLNVLFAFIPVEACDYRVRWLYFESEKVAQSLLYLKLTHIKRRVQYFRGPLVTVPLNQGERLFVN
jgi:hypothetical protein